MLHRAKIPVVVPSIASSAGLNRLTFFDDFDNINTIDVNNTGNPKYKWFTQNAYGAFTTAAQPSSTIACSNSILTLSNVGQGVNNSGLWTTWSSATNGSNSGCLFDSRKSFYVACKFAFDETLSDNTTTGFSAYNSGTTYAAGVGVSSGGSTYKSLAGSNTNHTPVSSPTWWVPCGGFTDFRWPSIWLTGFYQGNGPTYIEWDLLDALPGVVNTVELSTYVHRWSTDSVGHQQASSLPSRASIGNPVMDGSTFHTLEGLYTPANAGTGSYQTWFDGNIMFDVTFSRTGMAGYVDGGYTNSNGLFSEMETEGAAFSLSLTSGCQNFFPGSDWNMKIDWVKVYQA